MSRILTPGSLASARSGQPLRAAGVCVYTAYHAYTTVEDGLSEVVSLRLKGDQVAALRRAARRMGRTVSETAALFLEEALRQRDFAFIAFRDSPVGRQAYLQGTRLPVWRVVSLVREYGGSVDRAAEHLGLPSARVQVALRYAEAFPDEIEAATADSACALDDIERLVPSLQVLDVDALLA